MATAIFGETIGFQMNDARAKSENRTNFDSALQNSDLHRAQINALLRRNEKTQGARGGRSFWQAFTSYYASTCANSNE